MVEEGELAQNVSRARRRLLTLVLLGGLATATPRAVEPIRYRFTFPEPQHRWMQVEASFPGIGPDPLEVRMSQSSPGRYALHDFAKNVYDVRAFGADGAPIDASRPDASGWTVRNHGGAATLQYKVYGDRIDGTYLAIDPTHAHINIPAAVMWARGLDDRPAILTFEPPDGVSWRLATQLFPGATPYEVTAPNLQYLMDSPVEFGPVAEREFRVDDRVIRLAVHHTGADAELDEFVRDVQKIVAEEGEIFGEYPPYEPGRYTFLADYLPYASQDGMEHRNSTVMTSSGTLRDDRLRLLDTVSHEFFHGWNVERVRPRSLEPFDLDRVNPSGELWLAEGFTQYYGALVLKRAGLMDVNRLADTLNGFIGSIAANPARLVRSAEEMSRMAVFTDGARTIDPTNWSRTVISYYQFGGAIALAMDLSLRDRSNGSVTLDDYMRAMWRVHGKPGGTRPGYVEHPYTMTDAEARLADVSENPAFAREFFGRYIQGHEVADYAPLLLRAGLVLRPSQAGRAWLGEVRLDDRGGVVRVSSSPPIGSPAYDAGLDVGDEIRQLDSGSLRSIGDVAERLRSRKPGDSVALVFIDRAGVQKSTQLRLGEDPDLELIPIESTGGALTAAQKAFRSRWLD